MMYGQIRAALGLPVNCRHSTTSSATKRMKNESANASQGNFLSMLSNVPDDGQVDPDLRLYVMQRIVDRWRQQSSGASLVHAVSVWGWRRALAAAGELAEVLEQQVSPCAAASSAGQPAGHIYAGKEAAASQSLNGAGIAALFSARRQLMHVRGFMADFPSHMPCEARAGSSIFIGAARSTNRVLGSIFVDWRGCALKLRRYRTVKVGARQMVLGERHREQHRCLLRCLTAWHQLSVQKKAELDAAEVPDVRHLSCRECN